MKLINANGKPALEISKYIVEDVTPEDLDQLVKDWLDYKWALSMARVGEKYGFPHPDIDISTVEDLVKWSKQESYE